MEKNGSHNYDTCRRIAMRITTTARVSGAFAAGVAAASNFDETSFVHVRNDESSEAYADRSACMWSVLAMAGKTKRAGNLKLADMTYSIAVEAGLVVVVATPTGSPWLKSMRRSVKRAVAHVCEDEMASIPLGHAGVALG